MALQQGHVTITGRVGSTPQGFGHSSPPSICTFRLGCRRGYYDANRQWKTLPTTWITVKTYRALAANVISSVRTGQPVIVVGMLATEEWTADNGEKRSRNVLEASSVGHDLNYGTSHLNMQRRDGTGANGAAGAANGQGGPNGMDPNAVGGRGGQYGPAADPALVGASLSASLANDPFRSTASQLASPLPASANAASMSGKLPGEPSEEPSGDGTMPAEAAALDDIPPAEEPPSDDFGAGDF
ncbi:single-stranded DNA-binding protein [Bifidobacterium biavatii]|uniref:Single-strand binding protein n=1 Tax=Bifidobacterium biavatii DSM 23969 TaxID=1437608 RepID=A0A086ZVX5_9BIFI|nr:single-stranded DNA-binding protein [Bifidobacterium biavatii]KFI50675.1 single-strand binding protein [Bifidobacterium biavatii DSM 23969]